MTTTVQQHARPWLARAAQFPAGALLGAVCAYIGMVIGRTLFAGDPAGFGDIVASIGGIMLGFPLGAALGVTLLSRVMQRRTAFWATVIGGFSGSWSVFVLAQLLRTTELLAAWGLFFIFGVIGAMLADWLALRRKG